MNVRKERTVSGETEVHPITELATLFKALSDGTRLRILKLLGNRELCVCDMVAAFDMTQPKVSFHLGVLKQAGLLKDRREGKWMHYRIDDSDLFKRFLILSITEKIPADVLKEDGKRLEAFLDTKTRVTPCCGEKPNGRKGAVP
jgi:ArsR family transcriptional regulator, arsenate/arsenite/antimonite-responsive transcriptional repressor